MGLDNIPVKYPCVGNEIRDEEGRIDCAENQKNGRCTWKNEYESSPLLKDAGPTYGMLGTDCWYRGKWGNVLLDLLAQSVDHDYSFYGKGLENGDEGISPEECFEMSNFMKEYIEEFAYIANNEYPDNSERYIQDYIYASWWLDFTGKFGEGSGVWY